MHSSWAFLLVHDFAVTKTCSVGCQQHSEVSHHNGTAPWTGLGRGHIRSIHRYCEISIRTPGGLIWLVEWMTEWINKIKWNRSGTHQRLWMSEDSVYDHFFHFVFTLETYTLMTLSSRVSAVLWYISANRFSSGQSTCLSAPSVAAPPRVPEVKLEHPWDSIPEESPQWGR